MAKVSMIERNKRNERLVKKFANRRAALKEIINDKEIAPEERFKAVLKLSELPRNSSKTRLRNRCEITGRPRAYYRKFNMCRVKLRELASDGKIPGMVKSSW
jgi:small subunit ribosomal protein S14